MTCSVYIYILYTYDSLAGITISRALFHYIEAGIDVGPINNLVNSIFQPNDSCSSIHLHVYM